MAYDDLVLNFRNNMGFNLRIAASAAMARFAEALARLDLRIVEASILMVIYHNQGCRQSQIGKALNISSANMTPLISRLEEREIVLRKAADGRSNALYLTDKGCALTVETIRVMEDFETELAAQIPVNLRKPFSQALMHLSSSSLVKKIIR